ncbi:multidrug transporter [Acinetobacter sp. NCu2D-2]|uniref:MdfA family multidrug efflux MFS transporter n=1 Tax=Acinetobacter sp. NCu2D-2 TaxID=1608473 RepID=UPI0007CDDFCC|nr:MdfA family multidrug efflux MFS transporter [Acinetobacter sp. NCu2D-2]ANF82106.1 multidrug transporter [Acinetobacter sp. NCu2D-2]
MSQPQISKLTLGALLFPLALVLFEFAVYLGNDLVQPAMLGVTRDFGVSSSWAPSSMSFYLLGGGCLAWLMGPLSDRIGRKKVLLTGALFFTAMCLLILFMPNIQSFLGVRFLQGIGLTVISAVGYAAIQENFEERTAIKVMALMGNMTLMAPLLGPVIGAFLIDHISWHWGFIGIAVLSMLGWLGLKLAMPNDQKANLSTAPMGNMWADFKKVYSNKQFLVMTSALPMASLPIMMWIALSPVMLVEKFAFTGFEYGLAQIPVLGALILGSVLLMKIVDKYPLGQTVLVGLPIMLVGSLVTISGLFVPDYSVWLLIIGMTLMSFGEGICFSVLYRLAMMSSDVSKGTVASAMSMMMMLIYFTFLEISRHLYEAFDMLAFSLCGLVLVLLWFTLPRKMLKQIMQKRKENNEF